jgi:uncharacterized membrane protein HdeD (DUF308 family)
MDNTALLATPAPESAQRKPRAWGVALLMVGVIAAFYLLREHWNHVAGFWPYLFLLLCPLMHVFHGHGGRSGHGHRDSNGPRSTAE